jgi:hypothetical protein
LVFLGAAAMLIVFLVTALGPWQAPVRANGGGYILMPVIANKGCSRGPGIVTGKVLNAVTEAPVVGATVCFGSLCTTTDTLGNYTLEQVPSGNRVLEASASGFNSVLSSVNVPDCRLATLNFALSSFLSGDRILRAVLTWDPTDWWRCAPCGPGEQDWPNDLDIHFWILDLQTPSNSEHINSGNSQDRGVCDQFPSSRIEADAIFGFGPETLDVCAYEDAVYHYGVLNVNQYYPGNVPPITGIGAEVKIYLAQGLFKTYHPPSTGAGDFWYVFTMNGITGVITDTNCITYLPGSDLDPPQCPP